MAPSAVNCCTTAGVRSYTTQLCPAFSRRRTMFAPILPRPIIPSCILYTPTQFLTLPVARIVGETIREKTVRLVCRFELSHAGGLARGVEQSLERVGEEFHAVLQQLLRDFLHRNSGFRQIFHRFGSSGNILGQARAQLAVIAERIESGRRNRVHSVGADQFFNVKNVAILGILGAGAGPKEPLCLGTLWPRAPSSVRRQRAPGISCK